MTTDYLDKTIDFYNAHSRGQVTNKPHITLTQELTRFTRYVPAGRILDQGCSFGRDTDWFAKAGYETVGIDLSPGMIAESKKRYPDLNFQVMDVRHLDFSDEYFDGVWSSATLLHLNPDDIDTAMQEVNRVLKPGGVFYVSFMLGSTNSYETREQTMDGQPLSRFFTDHTDSSLRRLLGSHGLRIIEGDTANERKRHGADKRNMNWLNFFARKP